MGWADALLYPLSQGNTVKFRPKGDSMKGRIDSGQQVTVQPTVDPQGLNREVVPAVGDAVLCKVNGKQYLHLIKAIGSDGRFQIGNNKGHINGWTTKENIFGVVTKVED